MARKIRWTRRALRRLDEIGAYISKDDPGAASKVVQRIFGAVDFLSVRSEIGRTGRIESTRELVLPDISYIVVYRITESSIDILTVMHTAQRWPLTL